MVLCIEQQQQRHQFSISKLILPYIWKFCSKFSSNLEARQQWRKFFYSNVGGLSDGPPELNTDKRASYDNLECIYDNCRRRRPPLYLDFDKIMPLFYVPHFREGVQNFHYVLCHILLFKKFIPCMKELRNQTNEITMAMFFFYWVVNNWWFGSYRFRRLHWK